METFLAYAADTNITTDGSGNLTLKKAVLTTGSLSRIVSVGQTTIAHGGTSVTHTLGVVPDVVLAIIDAGAAATDIISVNYGTMSATAFTAYTSNAGSTNNVRFLCFKF